jgi:uncharacterized protein (TIGR00255 family)
MLMSMTGFGRITDTFNDKKISIEIRTLNSKNLDINLKIHNNYKELEPEIRKVITSFLERGKIDVTLNLDSTGDTKTYKINLDLAKSYYKDLKYLNENIGHKTDDYLPVLIRMPDIFINEREELLENEKIFIINLTKEACNKVNEFRNQEGLALEIEFTERIEQIIKLLNQIPKYERERLVNIREKIHKNLEESSIELYDKGRFENELIYYIEKLDISEEKMRLSNHLDYFLSTMKSHCSGKKLGFITQEIGREINTLGSKSNHVEMQKIVVEMKDNLEKIKEQVLNTL